MSLREQHAEVTRRAILTAARRLFAEQGYASTAVRPIAEEAGVALQTLYSTFGSKQGILLALVDTIREQTDAPALWARIGGSEDPLEMLRLAAHVRRQILERCGDIVVTFREGAAGDPGVAATYEEGQSRNRQGITGLVNRLIELGVDLDAKRAIDEVSALFSAEVYEELTGHRSNWSPDEYEDWIFGQLRGILLPS